MTYHYDFDIKLFFLRLRLFSSFQISKIVRLLYYFLLHLFTTGLWTAEVFSPDRTFSSTDWSTVGLQLGYGAAPCSSWILWCSSMLQLDIPIRHTPHFAVHALYTFFFLLNLIFIIVVHPTYVARCLVNAAPPRFLVYMSLGISDPATQFAWRIPSSLSSRMKLILVAM